MSSAAPTKAGHPFEVLGLPIPDGDRTTDVLSQVVPGLRSAWDRKAFESARDADVLDWLARSLDSPRVRGAASWAHMLDSIAACGLAHLLVTARAMMAAHPARKAEAEPDYR